MKALAAVIVLSACTAHDPALQHQVDTIAAQVAEIQRQVGALQQQASAPPPVPPEVTRKLDALQDEVAKLAKPTPGRRFEPDPKQLYAIKADGYPAQGPATALVTMVMAFDYADPYSERNREVRAELRKKYGDDLRIVYRNFVVHPIVATVAAVGGCAAHRQHKFFEYDAIAWDKGYKGRSFDHTDANASPCWTTAAGCPVTYGFARDAKLDLQRFKHDMPACAKVVQDDMAELQRVPVGATPTFFINGHSLIGAMPIDQFETAIDEALRAAHEAIIAHGANAATYYNDFVLAKGVREP
ncbi:MAG TPA: DsbA family protein [Kofleriaceae bacterium]|jgi:protein-disulfide isomerase